LCVVIVSAQTTLQSFGIFNIIFGVLERINCSKQFVNAIKCVWPILQLLWGHGFNLFSLLLRLTDAGNKEFSMLTERVSQLSHTAERAQIGSEWADFIIKRKSSTAKESN